VTVTYVGNLTIGAALPGADAAAVAGAAGINLALPDILARIAALGAFAPLPIDFASQLLQAQQIVANVQLGISMGLPVPDISAQIALISALISDLLAQVVSINGQLSIITTFQGLLAAAGLHVYAYAGAVNACGGQVTTALASGLPGGGGATAACNGLLLMTEAGATWSAMSSVFKVTP